MKDRIARAFREARHNPLVRARMLADLVQSGIDAGHLPRTPLVEDAFTQVARMEASTDPEVAHACAVEACRLFAQQHTHLTGGM